MNPISRKIRLLLGAGDRSARRLTDGADTRAIRARRLRSERERRRCAAVVVQADGKILIGGDFTSVSPNGGAGGDAQPDRAV